MKQETARADIRERVKTYEDACNVLGVRPMDEEAFRNTFVGAAWMTRCTELVVKKGWRVVFRNGALLRGARLVDLSYVPLKSDTPWYRQLPVRLSTPERWARAHNRIPEGGAEAEDTVYFMDFATEYAERENDGR